MKGQIYTIILNHITKNVLFSKNLKKNQTISTLAGTLLVTVEMGAIRLQKHAFVTTRDIIACDGVIHKIESIIFPECDEAEGLSPAVSVTNNISFLGKLFNLIVSVKLVAPLTSLQGYTFLAPTDAAFAKVQDLLDSLTVSQIISVLKYHVIPNGRFLASDFGSFQAVQSLEGSDVVITRDPNGNVSVNGVNTVINANLASCNAVIHVIDGVLLPPNI